MAIIKDTQHGLTAQRLRETLDYNPDTGMFLHKAKGPGHRRPGSSAGCKTREGRLVIRIGNYLYAAHRLAWLYVHGRWPAEEIDHINGIPGDNRIVNLREATHAQNMANRRGAWRTSKIGLRGVQRLPSGRYRARIKHMDQHLHIGCFDTAEEASAAADTERRRLFGEYAGGA